MSGDAKRPEREIGAIPPDADAATPKPPEEPASRRPRPSGVAGAGAAGDGRLGRPSERKDR